MTALDPGPVAGQLLLPGSPPVATDSERAARYVPLDPMARRAALRLLAVWPTDPVPPGTPRYADLATSAADCRVALTLALGQRPDVDGYPLDTPTP